MPLGEKMNNEALNCDKTKLLLTYRVLFCSIYVTLYNDVNATPTMIGRFQ